MFAVVSLLPLQPENLLLDSRTSHLKIADFGLSGLSQMAAGVEGEQLLHTQCGSPNYCAPEILAPASSRTGYNGALVDTWSVGVILYVLLAGRLPFYDPDPKRLYEAISHAPVQFPPNFPEGAADIVRKVLVKDPPGRMSLEEVQKHPWYLVGYEPVIRRRHRRPPRSQAAAGDAGSSGSLDDATNGSGSSTPITVDGSEEAVEARPPRSVLPATTTSSNARRLVDEDAPGGGSRDEGGTGRRSPRGRKKPPRPTGTTDTAEVVSIVVRHNGSGEHAPQEKRSSSSDGLLGTSGSEGGDVEDDGPSSGELAVVQSPRRHTGDAVPPLDVNFLNETMGADDCRLLVPSPGTTSSPGGQSRANGAPPSQPLGRTMSDETGDFTAVTRLAGRPPSPPRRRQRPLPVVNVGPKDGPELTLVDDADLDREADELVFHDEQVPVTSAPSSAGGRRGAEGAPAKVSDAGVAMMSNALAGAVVSGAPSRPTQPVRSGRRSPATSSGKGGDADAFHRDGAVSRTDSVGSGGRERRDSLGSKDGTRRRDAHSIKPSPSVPARGMRGFGGMKGAGGAAAMGMPPSSAPVAAAAPAPPSRLGSGSSAQNMAAAMRNHDESRRGRAGVRTLLGLSGAAEPPSFETALPARDCLRTIGTILSDMGVTVFLKKNQNKMKCQVGQLRGLPMWASICYVESEVGLNTVVFKRAREDHSRIDHPYLQKLCDSVHTQYRQVVELRVRQSVRA